MQVDMITTEEYARQSNTNIQFINQLGEQGLIEITIREQSRFIALHQLPVLEKFARLHYDLDINLEGIEAISHLLQRIEKMQNELETMRKTLRLYEPF